MVLSCGFHQCPRVPVSKTWLKPVQLTCGENLLHFSANHNVNKGPVVNTVLSMGGHEIPALWLQSHFPPERKTYMMATKTSTSDGSDPTKYTRRSRLSATFVKRGSKRAPRPGELPRTQTRVEHFKAATLKPVWLQTLIF